MLKYYVYTRVVLYEYRRNATRFLVAASSRSSTLYAHFYTRHVVYVLLYEYWFGDWRLEMLLVCTRIR